MEQDKEQRLRGEGRITLNRVVREDLSEEVTVKQKLGRSNNKPGSYLTEEHSRRECEGLW